MAVILIVDDDPKIRKLEDIYLRSEGFDTLLRAMGSRRSAYSKKIGWI